MPNPPAATPDEIADSAIAAASEAFESVKGFTAGIAPDQIHTAWLSLYEAGRASKAGTRDQETWIREATMMMLVGVQAVTEDEDPEFDDHDEGEDYDHIRVDEAWRLLAQGHLAEAEALADALLERAESRDPADAGDLIHHGHLIHGHVSLHRGDVSTAEGHLLAAADLVASPALTSFGPNMSLARALLLRGRDEAVLGYFDRCALFWGQLPLWRADILAGEMPRFGPNLIYGVPDDVQEEILGST